MRLCFSKENNNELIYEVPDSFLGSCEEWIKKEKEKQKRIEEDYQRQFLNDFPIWYKV
jgi:hypothetical protein